MKTGHYLCLNSSGFHKTAYTKWPNEDPGNTLICVHGLTRNGRDFDTLSHALYKDMTVVCPDIAGRGQSDWLQNPEDYNIFQYSRDMVGLLSHLGIEQTDWLGTSMGGLIGMSLACLPNSPIKRLILNDIGPFIPQAALQAIAHYLQEKPRFCSDIEAHFYLKNIHSGFGLLSDSQWDHLTHHSIDQNSRDEKGCFRLHYDPEIYSPFKNASGADLDLWSIWDQIQCPVLVLRGEESELLTQKTYTEMLKKPRVSGHVVPKTGHAPALMDQATITVIKEWLTSTQPINP